MTYKSIPNEETKNILHEYIEENPITHEDIIDGLTKSYQEGLISKNEYNYHLLLTKRLEELENIHEYDGKLTNEERQLLESSKVSIKNITKIEQYLEKYKEHLTSLKDLVGDSGIPSKLFYFNMDHFGYLLSDDPSEVITSKDIKIRQKYFDPIIKTLGPNFLHSKQVFENTNDLLLEKDEYGNILKEQRAEVLSLLKDKMNQETLPDEACLWVANHHFKDDVLATYLATKRASYILFGSMPQFYNTIDGIMAHMVGSYMTNRKVKSSRHASVDKAVYGTKLGIDTMCFPEAVWNKYPNELIIPLFSGFYRIAKKTGAKIIPICHYIYDPTESIPKKENPIHTVIDSPIDITNLSEKEALEQVRDTLASWYYLMMEKYGKTTRRELMDWYTKKALEYNPTLTEEDFISRPLTSHEAWELHMIMMMDTVDRYDKEIETSAHFQPREITRPEDVWDNIANIKHVTPYNVWDKLYASNLVRERKLENYQKRY